MNVKGFTLIELMVTLAVIAIATGFALPSFQHVHNQIKRDAEIRTWRSFIELARVESHALQSDVTLCPAVDSGCTNDPTEIWLAFTDINRNKAVDEEDQVLRFITLNDKVSVKLYKSGRNYFRFYANPTQLYSGPVASLSVCPNGYADEYSFHLKMNIQGRTEVETKRDAEGFPMRKANGKWVAVSC